MSNERWTYHVVEIVPKLRSRVTAERMQEELNRLGAQGWELVAVAHNGRALHPARLFLKRAQ
jgi:hypothetical protein